MGTLNEDPCKFMIISHTILLRMRNVSDKSCRENHNKQHTLWATTGPVMGSLYLFLLIIYCLCEIQAVLDFRATHTFVHNKFSPPIRLAYAKFGLPYTAGEQTFQAVAQWCSKTESQTVFCVY